LFGRSEQFTVECFGVALLLSSCLWCMPSTPQRVTFCKACFLTLVFADVEMLGPHEFEVMQKSFERLDMSLKNKRGLLLECSWYRQSRPQQPTPCIIYLHGNSGCRCDADDALLTMLPYGVSGERHQIVFILSDSRSLHV
jgi:hypothetical protein